MSAFISTLAHTCNATPSHVLWPKPGRGYEPPPQKKRARHAHRFSAEAGTPCPRSIRASYRLLSLQLLVLQLLPEDPACPGGNRKTPLSTPLRHATPRHAAPRPRSSCMMWLRRARSLCDITHHGGSGRGGRGGNEFTSIFIIFRRKCPFAPGRGPMTQRRGRSSHTYQTRTLRITVFIHQIDGFKHRTIINLS